MSDAITDHDQRLKVLLKEFFDQFFGLFFPEWADRFDFAGVRWLDKEVFLAPPQGEKRILDLLARVPLKPGTDPPRLGLTELIALIHVEIESRESAAALRPRMFEYFTQLEREFGLPVLPIGLLLRVGLDGVGWDAHELHFWDRRVLRFEYAYVGLPALNPEIYLAREQILGAALSSLMKVPAGRRAELYLEGLKRIATSGENDYRQYLLAECLEAYAGLDDTQKKHVDELLETEPYREAKPLMLTTYERGKIAGEQNTLLLQLEKKFGSLPDDVRHRVEEMTPEQLRKAILDFVDARTLADLGLGSVTDEPT